jgi:DNA-binding response OmpR family regulator
VHILLIDDEVHHTGNLVLYLRSRSHTCVELRQTSTEEHLHAYLKDNQPDCVVLDFGMTPSGDTVYKWIKNWRPTTKIIFYTNYAESANERRLMLKAGAAEDEIIEKREVGSDVTKILQVL